MMIFNTKYANVMLNWGEGEHHFHFFTAHISTRDGFLGKRQEENLVGFYKELLFVGLTLLPCYFLHH